MADLSSALAMDFASDEDIVARILNGEVHLFEVIVRRHSQRLFRTAISVLRNDSDAEDVVQDTLVSAYQHLAQFAGRARFSTWLSRIALYKALARTAARSREVRLETDNDDAPVWLMHHGPTPEQIVCEAETAALLSSTIESLPDNYRRVIELRHVEEKDTETTARELNITATNAKVRLHRAHAMLRNAWERNLTSAKPTCAPEAFALQ